jgi:uncharacterized integral membrane protein (TIGR00698 family)
MNTLARVLVPLGAALCLLPFVSAPVALVAGIALALTLGNPYLVHTRAWTHRLLTLSVVGLGAGMNLHAVAEAGARGFGYTVVSILGCLALGALLARALKVERAAGLLITAGTAICGGSAIAALVPVLRPKEHEVSVALGTVFLLNAAALVVFPPVGHLVGLSPERFGLWSALAIHDTSSVVGAAIAYGGGRALEVATTVKLARALWIVPLALGFGLLQRRHESAQTDAPKSRPRRPWFILGFVLAAALVTWVPQLRPAGQVVSSVAKQTLVLTLFLIGAGITRASLKSVGVRPMVLGVGLWVVVGALSLAAIASGLIG